MMGSLSRRAVVPGMLVLLASSAASAANRAWETVIPDASEEAFVVLDATGSPRVVSKNASGLLRYAALDRDGNILASGAFPAAADGLFRGPNGAASTIDGGAASCGGVTTPAMFPAFPTMDGLAVRFSPTGSPLWSKVLGDAELGLCGLHSLSACARTSGAIYAVGTASPPPPFPGPPPTCPFIPANFKAFLIRLDESGGTITGLRTFSMTSGEAVYSAVASSGGPVYALGARGSSMIVDKYDTDLNLVWSATATTSGLNPISIAVSSQGVIATLGQRGTLDARVIRLAPDGSFLGEAVVVFPETSGVALTDGSTSYVSGRRSVPSSRAALASASPSDVVAVEFEDTAAQRYLSVAVDSGTGIFAGVERIGDVRVARFAPAASSATSRLSIRAGDNQTGTVNTDLPVRLEVLLLDASSAPAAGVPVIFSVSSEPAPGTGASVTPTNAQSGPDGVVGTTFKVGSMPFEYKISCNCPGCGPTGSSVTFSACGKLANDDFEQFDPRWSTTTYDNTTSSMGAEGCAVTSLATLNNFYRNTISTAIPQFDPDTLNRALVTLGRQGYVGRGLVQWRGVEALSGNRIRFVDRTDVDATNTIQSVSGVADADLAAGRPVVMKVSRRRTNGTFGEHFVLAVGRCRGEYIIADPGSGTRAQFDPNDANFQLRGIRRYAPAP